MRRLYKYSGQDRYTRAKESEQQYSRNHRQSAVLELLTLIENEYLHRC